MTFAIFKLFSHIIYCAVVINLVSGSLVGVPCTNSQVATQLIITLIGFDVSVHIYTLVDKQVASKLGFVIVGFNYFAVLAVCVLTLWLAASIAGGGLTGCEPEIENALRGAGFAILAVYDIGVVIGLICLGIAVKREGLKSDKALENPVEL